jgi:hypothetical protein
MVEIERLIVVVVLFSVLKKKSYFLWQEKIATIGCLLACQIK